MIKPARMTNLLTLVAAEPTLLSPAPELALTDGAHIERRSRDEVHTCLGCGNCAELAFVAGTRIGPRWLDLCHACAHQLHEEDGDR